MKLKRLSGLGEVSSVGMYRETGILVKAVADGSKWWKKGLREKDVILAAGENEITDEKEAIRLLACYTGELLIWREQAEKYL